MAPDPGDGSSKPTLSGETPPDDVLHLEAQTDCRYQPGQIIARKYALVRPLTSGGMGALWVARDETLDVDVAIKLLRLEMSRRSDIAADRMLNEARATAKLGHPAIVRVMDFGRTDEGTPFLVMELLEGTDLGNQLELHDTIAATRAVQTLVPICHALATAHDKRIVHRDIKPENIFLAKLEGGRVQPKLLDFGVVKLDRHVDKRLTTEGMLVGSPGYMSPEQARGRDVDHRSDIFSVCVVLYELVSGTLPFEGDNWNALMRSIIEDEPVPITQLGAGDATLWAIIERGLAKDPADRWESAHDLGKALSSWLAAQEVFEDITGVSLSRLWEGHGDVDDPLSGDRTSALPAIAQAERAARTTAERTPPSQRAWMTSSPQSSPVSNPDTTGPFQSLVAAPPAPAEKRFRFMSLVAAAVVLGAVLIWRLTPSATSTAPPETRNTPHVATAPAAAADTISSEATAAIPATTASAPTTHTATTATASASASASAPRRQPLPPPRVAASVLRPKSTPPPPARPQPALKPPTFD